MGKNFQKILKRLKTNIDGELFKGGLNQLN